MDKVILVGNGIGMAIDPSYFSLQSAIYVVWQKLNEDEKNILSKLFRISSNDIPQVQEQNNVLGMINMLSLLTGSVNILTENIDIRLLSEEGEKLQKTVKTLIGKVAYYFHNFQFIDGEKLTAKFEQFTSNLCKSISDRKKMNKATHIVTLNYDDLLYEKFEEHGIFGCSPFRFSTCCLADGFTRSGDSDPDSDLIFDSENLIPRWGNVYGQYLHLHGSPLFISRKNSFEIIKLKRSVLSEYYSDDNSRIFFPHVVLNSFHFKEFDIKTSPLLNTYLIYFKEMLKKAEEIILFGYAGLDIHVNKLIALESNSRNDKNPLTIKVIEYKNPMENDDQRYSFWLNKFLTFRKNDLLRYSSILDYSFLDHL